LGWRNADDEVGATTKIIWGRQRLSNAVERADDATEAPLWFQHICFYQISYTGFSTGVCNFIMVNLN
jgi:hypothetical protein